MPPEPFSTGCLLTLMALASVGVLAIIAGVGVGLWYGVRLLGGGINVAFPPHMVAAAGGR